MLSCVLCVVSLLVHPKDMPANNTIWFIAIVFIFISTILLKNNWSNNKGNHIVKINFIFFIDNPETLFYKIEYICG